MKFWLEIFENSIKGRIDDIYNNESSNKNLRSNNSKYIPFPYIPEINNSTKKYVKPFNIEIAK